MKKYLTLIAFSLTLMHEVRSQNPVFSQFYSSGLFLNPALCGMEKDVVLGVNYRSQWANVNLPFKTVQVSAIHPILHQGVRAKHLGGFGGTIFSDEAGARREFISQGFSVASSYNFHFNNKGTHMLAAALQLGVHQRRINMDALQWSSQYAPALGYDHTLPGEKNLMTDRVTHPVINTGVMWRLVSGSRSKPLTMYYQGLSVSNINRPDGFFREAKSPASMLFKAHGGYLRTFRSGVELSPNYLVQYQHSWQVNIGLYGAYALGEPSARAPKTAKVSLGVWYRLQDSYIITAGLGTPSWSLGFSYDTNAFALERSFGGANACEMSFMYRISVIKEHKRFSSPLL